MHRKLSYSKTLKTTGNTDMRVAIYADPENSFQRIESKNSVCKKSLIPKTHFLTGRYLRSTIAH
jgi:hypothetical protein